MSEGDAKNGDDWRLLQRAAEVGSLLRGRLAATIVGQDAVVEAMVASVFAGGHCLVIGVPGLAKTKIVRTFASLLGWKFRRIQFTPDMMPADITGTEMIEEDRATGKRRMEFMPGPVFANMVLADEINRAPPKTQSALLEAMQELTVTTMGRSVELERPFVVIATQNPIEQEGTYPLPEAQLDRFMTSLWIDYPARGDEERMVAMTTSTGGGASGAGAKVEPVVSTAEVLSLMALVERVPAAASVVNFAVALVRATRPNDESAGEEVKRLVEWGAGPRAAQHLVLMAKALAMLDGRPAASIADVKKASPWVLRHRLVLNYRALGEKVTPAEIIQRLLGEAQSR